MKIAKEYLLSQCLRTGESPSQVLSKTLNDHDSGTPDASGIAKLARLYHATGGLRFSLR